MRISSAGGSRARALSRTCGTVHETKRDGVLSSETQITDGLNQGSSGEQGSSPELIWRNRSVLPRTIKTESSPIHRRNMFFQWRSVGEQSI